MINRTVIIVLSIILVIALAGRALLHYHGLQVTSWFRSPWHNYRVGGKLFSLHLIGWAYDVVPKNVLLHRVLSIWPFRYVIESDHVHLQIL